MNANNEDPFKREGHLQLKIDKFSEFARQPGAQKLSEPVHVLGLPWQILAIANVEHCDPFSCKRGQNWLAFHLKCNGDSTDPSWACTASATFNLLAQKEGKRDSVHEANRVVFKANAQECGFSQFMTFKKLTNPESGWYDAANDCIVLAVDFTAQTLRGIILKARPDVFLVNGKEVRVDKNHLASQSSYFERFFFAKGYEKESINIVTPASVEDFKRLMETMQPNNRPLDDGCIEGVYHLANQFLLADVEEKCRHFLASFSKHSAIFKYRLADKYGFKALKKLILTSSKDIFSKEADFFENVKEYAKLDERTCRELDACFGQLFGKIAGEELAHFG